MADKGVRATSSSPTSPSAWTTREILVAAMVAVAFGTTFVAWNQLYGFLGWLPVPWPDTIYGLWLAPAVLAPLLVRKPGAALFAEMTAAGISTLLGSPWGPETLLSGFVQGAAAELVFAMSGYRTWSVLAVGLAATASAAAAWTKDWAVYLQRRGA